jgi:GTPase SAR1 family protein
VEAWISNLQNEQQKLDKLEMVLAVIGTMKAGKSTTINAIVGMEILPNRETAMTTLPTLIRNIHGQSEPVLKIAKITPLLELSQRVAEKLQSLDETAKSKINLQGVEDGKALINQLTQQGSYPFQTEYSGQTGIFEFLKHLNDIMRLAKDAAVGVDVDATYSAYQNLDDLPVIEVEFYHLRSNQDVAHGSLAILDTPGPNEFGQSDALKAVFTTQLAKASAVLLVTDFTQMNTEADHAVREQLEIIKQQLSKEHLYVIVNKFDNANANTSSKERVKEYVAGLMQDYVEIEVSQVFPVSSYYAYLANRAKRHLDQHEKLPCHKQQPWVADFAETALGRRWESKIDDIAEVKACIDELWNDSFFAEPINKVIKEAHADAANRSLESALKKLAAYNNEFVNRLGLYATNMTQDINKIQSMKLELEQDIKRCEQVKEAVNRTTDDCLVELEQAMGGVMKAQQKNIHTTIEKFFQDGKRMELSAVNAMMEAELKKLDEKIENGRVIFSLLTTAQYRNKNERAIKEKFNQRFDSKSTKINFGTDNYAAKKLTNDVTGDVEAIFKEADKELNSMAGVLIKKTAESISMQVNDVVKETLKKAQDKLKKGSGVDLNFKLPDIELKIADVDASVLFNAGHHEDTRTYTSQRRTKGAWGTVCRWFKTDDWGWEEYTERETVYTVDLDKIKAEVMKQLDQQLSAVSNHTGEYLKKEFQPAIDNHLKGLVDYLKEYSGELSAAMESSKLDEASKTVLIKRLATLLQGQTTLKGDIEAINSAV